VDFGIKVCILCSHTGIATYVFTAAICYFVPIVYSPSDVYCVV